MRRALATLVVFDAWLISDIVLLAITSNYETEDLLPLLLHAPHLVTLMFGCVALYRFVHANDVLRWLLGVTMLACVTDTFALIVRIVMALRARSLTIDSAAHRHRMQCVYLTFALLFVVFDIVLALTSDSARRATQPRLRIDASELESDRQRIATTMTDLV